MGQAVEVVKVDTLLSLNNYDLDKEDLEHVTRYIWKRLPLVHHQIQYAAYPRLQNYGQIYRFQMERGHRNKCNGIRLLNINDYHQ